jgi:ferrous iron transport protein A
MLIFLFRVCYKEQVEGSRVPRGGRQTGGNSGRERMEQRPLSALRPGDRATIGRLAGGGPIRRRLLELGLTPGTRITMVRLAPLRDPMEIRVRGYQLCVRRSEADAVWVQVEPARPAAEAPMAVPALACAGAADGSTSCKATRGLFRLFHR